MNRRRSVSETVRKEIPSNPQSREPNQRSPGDSIAAVMLCAFVHVMWFGSFGLIGGLTVLIDAGQTASSCCPRASVIPGRVKRCDFAAAAVVFGMLHAAEVVSNLDSRSTEGGRGMHAD